MLITTVFRNSKFGKNLTVLLYLKSKLKSKSRNISTLGPWSKLRMLAEIVFEKINFGKQFQIHNIFHIKDHQKTT